MSDTIQRQNEYLIALHETTLGLIKRQDVNSLLQTIISRAGKLIGTPHCYIYLMEPDGMSMRMALQSGIFDTFAPHLVIRGEGVAGHIWEIGTSFHVADYCNWPGRLQERDRDALRIMAGVPLKSGNEVIGVLGLASIDEGLIINDEQMALLVQFGELASIALDNVKLFESAQRELSERRKAEEHLRKLSVAVEQNPASILITDTNGVIEYVNPHFTELTGYTAEEAIGQTPRILKTGNTTSEQYRQMWQTITNGNEWRGEFNNRKKNGDVYWEQALIAPIRDENSRITHFIAIKEDITDQKKLENQLRYSQKMEAVGQLAGGIAHDFNNILTAIIGYASIMQLKLPQESPYRDTAYQILATAERGASLTQGLLAFSRKQASNPTMIDINDIIRRIEKLLYRLIGEDVTLSTVLNDAALTVTADSIQIEQVLMNLSTNARDAMPDGGILTIKTSVLSLDNDFISENGFGETGVYALLTISDTGTGMDDETARRIFEPFYTTKEVGKGTGLGLSIVYGIIKKHNGYIICTSTPGTGTTFEIYLPLATADGIMQPEAQETEYRHGNELILLAEDDETIRLITRELLEEFGYSVIEAVDGLEAVAKFVEFQHSISLVILDAIMPGMKGIDVCMELRKIAPETPVLFCSGYTSDIINLETYGDGSMHFIAKPFKPKELLMKIREVLDDVS